MTIVIIGGGFSGTMAAVQLAGRATRSQRIVLIDPAWAGRGLAYGTQSPSHLLNVPAGRMSAFPDQPNDFLDWLNADGGEPFSAASFVLRSRYGDYLAHILHNNMGDQIALSQDEAVSVVPDGDGYLVRTRAGTAHRASHVVLALGNMPPQQPLDLNPTSFPADTICANPWTGDTFADLAPAAAVLLLGTGLTMVDMVMTLLDRGHQGPIHAVSRRGLLPHRHRAVPPITLPVHPLPRDLTGLLRYLRRRVADMEAKGGDWRAVMEELRPQTQTIWRGFTLDEKQRFLRHARRYWDIHRHRMPEFCADRIDAAIRSGQLQVRAGRLTALRPTPEGGDAVINTPQGRSINLSIAKLVNCVGPNTDYARIDLPLLRQMLADGLIRSDELGLGLDTAPDGRLIGQSGVPRSGLYALGPLTRGALWEITSVPDIRKQVRDLAETVLGD